MNLQPKDRVFVTVGDAQPTPGQIVAIREGWVRIAGRGSVDAGTYACVFDEWFPLDCKNITVKRIKGT